MSLGDRRASGAVTESVEVFSLEAEDTGSSVSLHTRTLLFLSIYVSRFE